MGFMDKLKGTAKHAINPVGRMGEREIGMQLGGGHQIAFELTVHGADGDDAVSTSQSMHEQTPAGVASLEPLESHREPLAVRTLSDASRKVQRSAVELLQELEHRPVVLLEEQSGHPNLIVRGDANQVLVECPVMD